MDVAAISASRSPFQVDLAIHQGFAVDQAAALIEIFEERPSRFQHRLALLESANQQVALIQKSPSQRLRVVEDGVGILKLSQVRPAELEFGNPYVYAHCVVSFESAGHDVQGFEPGKVGSRLGVKPSILFFRNAFADGAPERRPPPNTLRRDD